jgi:nitric oxide reductase NorQ protein
MEFDQLYDIYKAEYLERVRSRVVQEYQPFTGENMNPETINPEETTTGLTGLTKGATISTPEGDYTTIENATGEKLYVSVELFDLIDNLCIKAGQPVLLFGDAGTAKTELATAVFKAAGLGAIKSMEFGSITSGDQLDGERTFDADGKITTIPTELLEAMRVANTGVKTGLVLDELNRVATPAAVNKLLRALDSTKQYKSDLEGTYSTKDISFVATMNVGYSGTVRLNPALMDRFVAIEVKPIPVVLLEKMLIERHPGIDAKFVKKLCKLVGQTREKGEDARPISTRDAKRIVQAVLAGTDPVRAIETLIGGQSKIMGEDKSQVDGLMVQVKGVFAA